MAIPILSAYWIFQFRMVYAGVYLARYDQVSVSPDIFLRTIPQDLVIFAQVRAVLRHYRLFIVGFTPALLSFSLVVTLSGYKSYRELFFGGRCLCRRIAHSAEISYEYVPNHMRILHW